MEARNFDGPQKEKGNKLLDDYIISKASLVGKITVIGDFQVAFRLCFKVSPSAKPFIWK